MGSSQIVVSTESHVSDFPYDPSVEATWRQLVFGSADEAYKFYQRYARLNGFAVRIHHQHKKQRDGKECLVYLYYQCYKAGLKQVKKGREGVVVKERETIRTDCKAVMWCKYFENVDGYKITKWIDEHNHPMIESNHCQYLCQNRQISAVQENLIEMMVTSGVSQRATYESMSRAHGGRENVGFLRVDMKNMLNRKRQIAMLPCEATILLRWFRDQSHQRPGFFYDMQVDEEEEIASIFWADPTMIADYACYGDFVSFDVTYRTNKDYRPLAVFCGFNHHKGTCVFGAALLYDETTETISWLFEVFLRCMGGKYPLTIMTDQAHSIAAAAKAVLPNVFHGLCSWHIVQNAKKNLTVHATDLFLHEFHHLISHVDNEQQFEFSWNRMMEICFGSRPISDFSWLERTYPLRRQWSSAWVKKQFTAGKTTTQLSEQLNAYARFYLKPDHSISHFFIRFQAMLDDLRDNERKADFLLTNRVPKNRHPSVRIINQAAEVYTSNIFELFQDQYDWGQKFNGKILPAVEGVNRRLVVVERRAVQDDENSELLEDHTVTVDVQTRDISCTCCFFENWFVLCGHALRVMQGLSIWNGCAFLTIPDKYIKSRWTKKCKKTTSSKAVGELGRQSNDTISGRYQQWCAVMIAAGTRLVYNPSAFETVLTKLVDAVKEVEPQMTQTPPVDDSAPDGVQTSVGENEFSQFKLKKRKNPNTSNVRLKSQSEKSHLRKKQKCKRALAREAKAKEKVDSTD